MEEEKPPATAQDIKNKGNACVKDGKFEEAVLHYTHAIKLDPKNYTLYSNRSYAFLKLDQHYLAMQDAGETIRLEPNWAKGYYRRAEVEAASFLYDEAILSYSRALQLQPDDKIILESLKKATQRRKEKIISIQNTIWISTCLGFILGITIVVSDYALTERPSLTNPIAMVAFAMALAAGGYGVGKVITMMTSMSAGKSLLPPEELEAMMSSKETEGTAPEKKTKYSKAQARQRYKQGKL